jgi:hypothetical protein
LNVVGDEEGKTVILAGGKMWVHRAEQALKEIAPGPTQPALSPPKEER